MRQERTEFFLVERLVVSIFGRDPLHADMLHDMIVQRLVAGLFTNLDHAVDLVGFTFTHQIGDGRVENQNFKRRDASILVIAFKTRSGPRPPQRLGKRLPDFILLVGRENVN